MFRFLASLLKLTRAGNLMIIVFAQVFTVWFLGNPETTITTPFLLLVSGTLLVAAAGYIINDYYDIKIDYINKPEEVIIGNTITRRVAILFHVIFSIAGIGLGYLVNYKLAIINAGCVFLLWLYSNQLKRLPLSGNLTIGLLTATAIAVVDLVIKDFNFLIWVFALFAFFMTLIREIIKDMEDVKGDVTFGCQTLPIVYGIRRTKTILYVITGIFVVVVVIMQRYFNSLFLIYMVLFLVPALAGLIYYISLADTKNDFRRLSAWSKWIMLLGIISMAFA